MGDQAKRETENELREAWEEGKDKNENRDDGEVLGLSDVGERHINLEREMLMPCRKASEAILEDE